MMNGSVPELACRDRLRSRDLKEKNKEEEEEEEEEMKMNNYNEDDEEEDEDDQDTDVEEEERKTGYGDKKVKKWKAPTAVLEKKKRGKLPINLEEDVEVLEEKAKNKGEKRMHGGDDKTKYRNTSTITIEREKNKKPIIHGREHKIHIGHHDKDKRRNTLLPLDKNISLKEKSRKMPSSHNCEKKMPNGDHRKDKRKIMHINSKHFEKEKRKSQSSGNSEKRIRSYDYGEHKVRRGPHPFNNDEMQKNEMKKKKNTTLDLSKENKIQMMADSNENKRKKTTEMYNKRKKTKDKDEKAWSGDRWKAKNAMHGYNKEQKVESGHEEETNVPIAFIKLIYNNNFEEFLLIPPVVGAKLKDLTNRRVNLEDSEGNFSKVRLSVVDGSLAFYEGWNNFVSNHSIKFGDFLLFEYTARSQLSVRVFGMDSCERVCFSVERLSGKKQKGWHAPDETENVAKSMNAVSGARHVAVNSKEDPNRAMSGVKHGSSIALYDKDGYLANGKHKANDIFQTWSKGTRGSDIILINDDEVPLTQENGDTEKLKTLDASSETHCVTANTKEDPKGVVSGPLCGTSVALDNEGTLTIGECKTNCISSICSTEKTRSEIIPVIDTALLAQENDDAVELTTFPLHIEDTSMMKESEPEIATRTKCADIQGSDEDLRRKQEGNTVQLECTTAVNKCPNNSKMNTSGNICSKHEDTSMMKESETETATPTKCTEIHNSDEDLRKKQEGNTVQLECTTAVDKCPNNRKMNTNGNVSSKNEAPGGSPSLEKWNKATVSGRAALDGTGLIKPERLRKTKDRLVGGCSSIGVNSFEQLLQGGSPSLEKWKKATVSGRAALDGTGLIKPEKLLKTEDRLVGSCSSMGVNSFQPSLEGYAGRAALDCTGLIRPEKRLKTDGKLVGNCSATGVSPVEQSLRVYAGTHSCVQQTPGKISKLKHIKKEIDLSVNGKGPTAQPKTHMEQFEPMCSIACRQQMNNISVRADHVVARLSEHHFFSQEDRKASHHVTPAALLPVKVELSELVDHSVLKANLQFCIPSTTQTWLAQQVVQVETCVLGPGPHYAHHLNCLNSRIVLDLPSSLSNALWRKGRQDRNVVMLKDPMKRLWPVFYHKNSLFVGFTRGWKPFVVANNLQPGDVCMLLKDLDEDELVYHVQITRK